MNRGFDHYSPLARDEGLYGEWRAALAATPTLATRRCAAADRSTGVVGCPIPNTPALLHDAPEAEARRPRSVACAQAARAHRRCLCGAARAAHLPRQRGAAGGRSRARGAAADPERAAWLPGAALALAQAGGGTHRATLRARLAGDAGSARVGGRPACTVTMYPVCGGARHHPCLHRRMAAVRADPGGCVAQARVRAGQGGGAACTQGAAAARGRAVAAAAAGGRRG
jgi:hypothetical protein